jgi:hypothetical protein
MYIFKFFNNNIYTRINNNENMYSKYAIRESLRLIVANVSNRRLSKQTMIDK